MSDHPLFRPLSCLAGVGAAKERTLAAAGLVTLADLLWYLPYRYEDRSTPRPITKLNLDAGYVTVRGRVIEIREKRAWKRHMHIVEAAIDDGTACLAAVWFNQHYLTKSLSIGDTVWLYGPLRPGYRGLGLQIIAPEWEIEDENEEGVHLGRVVPIYRRAGSWSGRRLRSLMVEALAGLEDVLPADDAYLPAELGLPSLRQALREVHFPSLSSGEGGLAALHRDLLVGMTPAHRRLALEELAGLAVAIERQRQTRATLRAPVCVVSNQARQAARQLLPFRLTSAQTRVIAEIAADLQRPEPMSRLLQGDVGSGKTIVAALAALLVLDSGHQVAMLAPTELLAQQHHNKLSQLFSRTSFPPELLIGSRRAKDKVGVRSRLAGGEARFVVGTHALIEDAVVFDRLGLAIIDEQHRFGVLQRQALLDKGATPHLLVMTATPIPRSLALSLYGDLEVSILDELPPGRTPVRTVVRDDHARDRLLDFIRREVRDGGQAYWVFPLIEESEKLAWKALESHVDALTGKLDGVRLGIVHGRLSAEAREATMEDFVSGRLGVLCATTVIEVGVDVPNASVMVIENAERFGLAQLHQLRGRVGRGRRRSVCVLLTGEDCSAEARKRLEFFSGTNDGFLISEEDFRARGSGELTGSRQWGRAEFRVANLVRHRSELEAARRLAANAAAAGQLEDLASSLCDFGLSTRPVQSG